MTGYNMEKGYTPLVESIVTNNKGVKFNCITLDSTPDFRNQITGSTVLIDGEEWEYTFAMDAPALYAVLNYEGSLMGKTLYFKH